MRTSYIALALAVALSACSRNPDPVVVQPGVPGQQQVVVQPQVVQPQDPGVVYQQPQVVQAQPQVIYQQPQQPVVVQQHDSSGNLLTGMAIGALAGHALSNSNSTPRETTVIRETVYRDTNGRYRDSSTGRFVAAPTTVAQAPAPATAQKLNVKVQAPPPPVAATPVTAQPLAVKVAAPAPAFKPAAPVPAAPKPATIAAPAPKVAVKVSAPPPATKK